MKLARKLFCLICLLTVCFLLCGSSVPEDGWSREKAYTHNEECTRAVLDALLKGDPQKILDVMGLEGEERFFSTYRHIAKTIRGNVGYDLVVLQNHSYTEEGFLIHRSNYRVTFSDERVYALTVYGIEGMDGLTSFEINQMETEKAENLAPAGWVHAMTILTLAGWALVVWMIVDCVRRPMKILYKVLWIVAILAFAGVSVQWWSDGFSFFLHARFHVGVSEISLIGGLWKLQVMLPVGAMVYFFLRKKITARYLAARKAFYDQNAPLDFTLGDQ